MTANDMMAEIRDANLSYLMLAQQMIRADKVTAIFRLGIAAEGFSDGLDEAAVMDAARRAMAASRAFDRSATIDPIRADCSPSAEPSMRT